jgi:transcription-repair coupling factor
MEWTGEFIPLFAATSRAASDADSTAIIITDHNTLEESLLPAVGSVHTTALKLAVGDAVSVEALREQLTEYGYEREKTANASGRWAQRGGIIDVFVDQPIRIELDGEDIVDISVFDLASGKRVCDLNVITIPPLHLPGRSSALDYLGDAVVVVSQYAAVETRLPQLVIQPFKTSDAVAAGYRATKSYHLRYPNIIADAKRAHHVMVFSEFSDKVKTALADVSPEVVKAMVSGHGFTHATTNTLVLTDTAIGLTEQKHKKQSQRVREALIQGLTPGDYVVHLYHGIARFAGMTQMPINGMTREYFVLGYGGEDKVYVPVERVDLIDKYIGADKPTVHRLADASWNEVVARVKAQTLELAHRLLNTYARRSNAVAPQFKPHADEKNLDAACPFELTKDQNLALHEVLADLGESKPMDRLLCGDVGFGKTEVAMRAAFRAAMNGHQVALLAPTTVLVQQHVDTFIERLRSFGVNVGSLSRFLSAKQQRETIAGIHNGTVDIVIGTHRMLSKDVQWKKLGLIIVDEEQRFGVKAKETLTALRAHAHVLTMTATPIPRTLNLSLSGVRDISTILTPPQERKSVRTIIQQYNPTTVKEAIQHEMERNGQTYYIYNRVQSIEHRKNELQTLLPKARIGIAHGQMDEQPLASVMHAFDTGELDILLATTIVENGLDIPTANTMIVENASAFGLAELYQLKGRVGRSYQQGHAYFLYTEKMLDHDARQRLTALQEASHLGAGFELAMKDMEIRGVGNFLGKEQHGHAVRVGLNLYVRLLNQVSRELEGVEELAERDIPIDLPMEARIPEEVIADEGERILLYQKLAHMREIEQLHEQREKYADMHPSLAALFDLLEIKLLAARSSLISIDTTYPSKHNTLTSPRITLTSDEQLPAMPLEWDVLYVKGAERKKARSSTEDLGTSWVKKLKETIQLLERLL